MTDFMICFLFCNFLISAILGIFLVFKRVLQKHLTGRIQYRLWFLFLGFLTLPFMPLRPASPLSLFSWLEQLKNTFSFNTNTITAPSSSAQAVSSEWMMDFALSVSRETPSVTGRILPVIWLSGIFVMLILSGRAAFRLHTLKKCSLPLQNKEIHLLYQNCLQEMNLTKNIPVYSTAFLQSPIITGLFKPAIYLPLHLISDYRITSMRYMLLHELQHYKHYDMIINYWMNAIRIVYWFNPFIWYALREMKNDREIACDSSVLEMLDKSDYKSYGNTLIDLSEKISDDLFSFSAEIGGTIKQLERRIGNIASFQKPTFQKRRKALLFFFLFAIFLWTVTPLLSLYAADRDHYHWERNTENISTLELSRSFKNYDGSFVLYHSKKDTWYVYNMEDALFRSSPDSTYKIYNALFGLEEGVITAEDSYMKWDNQHYPFEEWNHGQTLRSAMQLSVNWYFQSIDRQLGNTTIDQYIQKIGYGNENINGTPDSYWLESSLKISPAEQVQLLKSLYHNDFHFAPAHIDAVKDSLLLSSSDHGSLYGKTGTGRVNDHDINGWFIGYTEIDGNTCFFALRLRAEDGASGSLAREMTMSILSDLGFW